MKKLGDRMKLFYENTTRYFLPRRTHTLIRIDGKAFHTYTKKLKKPFDEGLMEDMRKTTEYLCSEIQGAVCGYTQSDEISILITDYKKITTSAWFNNNLQKMCSISASLATAKFNELRIKRFMNEMVETMPEYALVDNLLIYDKLAVFDARVFQIPQKEEVVNYFIWRQRDAIKNSKSMLAQSLYSHKELEYKNDDQQVEMSLQKGEDWYKLPLDKQRGSFCVRQTYANGKLIKNDDNESKLGELWYQPNNQSTFYPDKRGRLLEFALTEHGNDWCDIPIESIRKKWQSIDTPLFGEDRNSILNLL